jgi:hypothetical protein
MRFRFLKKRINTVLLSIHFYLLLILVGFWIHLKTSFTSLYEIISLEKSVNTTFSYKSNLRGFTCQWSKFRKLDGTDPSLWWLTNQKEQKNNDKQELIMPCVVICFES